LLICKNKIKSRSLKLTKLKSIVEGLNEKIHYSNNYLNNHDDPHHKELLRLITSISECVSKKFDTINRKFFECINPVKKSIDNEIISITGTNNKEQQQTMMKVDKNLKMNIDQLNMRRQELENITKITFQILELSTEMKKSAEKQGEICCNDIS
jgi:hypothetical protein